MTTSSTPADFIPAREAQALREVGSTRISRWVALSAMLLFILTLYGVALFEPVAESLDRRQGYFDAVKSFGSRVGESLGEVGQQSVMATNRALLEAIDEFEDRLEEESFLHRWVLPRIQWFMASTLGLGNEQAYIGDDGWLFYRPDIDYITGPGFLDPAVLAARRRGGDLRQQAPEPDPLPALLDFDRQLRERAIRLVVMPTPVKPTVQPENFSRRIGDPEAPLQNPSFEEFIGRLGGAGVEVFDPAPVLLGRKQTLGEAQYLRSDTHWTPQGVDLVAQVLAERLEMTVELSPSPGDLGQRRSVAVQGQGDIAIMLWLPADQRLFPPQRVTTSMVMLSDGRLWRPQGGAEVLLLGDSFSNIYSDATLGWGSGAGLAEQLSFHLRRPVDKLALNAGGALATRQVLQRTLASGEDRLAGKKVVIYQFATRELVSGDWRILR